MPKKKYEEQILAAVGRRNYEPLKPKALARKLGVSTPQYPEYRKALKALLTLGQVELAKNHTIRPLAPHGAVSGTFRRTSNGTGYVRPHKIEGQSGTEIRIPR
jgi:ribonuclease R